MASSLSILSLFFFALAAFASPLNRTNAPAGVPSYVLKYAPIVYLYSTDPYRPSDIGSQLVHTRPELNYTAINNYPKPLTLNNLNALNKVGGSEVYLTATDNITKNPSWLLGVKPDKTGKTNGAVSCAVIVVELDDGIVDAFYMYFYAFNYGGEYYGFVVGDHVGDWEHNMIRFKNGVPQAMWYSQHMNGEAFTYEATEKYKDIRPISFSANGSHANYAITGVHAHDIPDINLGNGIEKDYTDKGPLWDPTLSAYYYTYSLSTKKFAAYDASTPVNWLYFLGGWGDQQWPTSHPGQVCPLGISLLCKYQNGPTGPEDKDLNRTSVCPDNGYPCIIRPQLGP